MVPHTLRWRLPVSYVLIAALTVLTLGSVLLATLRGYYAAREREFLEANTQALASSLSQSMEARLPQDALLAHVASLSFISQSRVRVLDAGGRLLADSGTPQEIPVTVMVARVGSPGPGEVGSQPFESFVSVGSGPSSDMFELELRGEPSGGPPDPIMFSTIPMSSTAYGPGLGGDVLDGGSRSNQSATHPISGGTGEMLGSVELSEGPAYGGAVAASVARAWALSGVIAVLLAAAVGWGISRQLTVPLTNLTEAASRMATGDLASRAEVGRTDELGRLGSTFNEMASRVEATVATLRQFVADAAHELNTPLTALRTDLELAAAERGDPQRRSYLARAKEQLERLTGLTSALLELSRIEAAGESEATAPFDLREIVRDVMEPFASRAEQAGVSFASELPAVPVMIRGRAGQIRRAIANLLDNAVKFTPEGGAVKIGVKQEDDSAEVWVEDTGIGLQPEDLPVLFSRFHRGRNAAGYPGSGLGLAIVKAAVEAHGGRVQASSSSARTRFTLGLPISAG